MKEREIKMAITIWKDWMDSFDMYLLGYLHGLRFNSDPLQDDIITTLIRLGTKEISITGEELNGTAFKSIIS